MRKASILIPLHDNHFANRLCLEDAIANSGITDFELLFYNNGSTDLKVGEWAKSICQRKPGSQYFESHVIKRNSEVLNFLLNQATNEYVCIIPCPIFLSKNWLFEMICQNSQIIGSGITCIADHDNRGELSSKMNEDEQFTIVYEPPYNIVRGVFLFHWSICKQIGGFDPEMNQGFEFDQFCYRVGKLGLSNYYLCDFHGTKIAGLTPSCFFETTKEQYHSRINKMVKEQNFAIKISEATNNEKIAMKHITDVMNKFGSIFKKEFYLELSETFGFEIIGFAKEETKYLDDFCETYNLTWIVLPGRTMARAISIQFYDKQTK